MPSNSERGLSVVIITQDEERLIARVVEGCRAFADEIVVVDGGSRDRTVARARALGCVVFENPWPGYARQRNFGVEHATHDWIFQLDTDELPDAALTAALRRWKARASSPPALALRRTGNFLGEWFPDRKPHVRVYDRREVTIPDVAVHEAPDVDRNAAELLDGVLLHYGFRSIGDSVARFNRYTDLEAEKSFAAGVRFSLVRLLVKPIARAGFVYFARGGVRSGVPGIGVGILWGFYEFFHQLKLYELRWRAAGEQHRAHRGSVD